MAIADRLDALHAGVKKNRWFRYFAIFNRIVLAAGFLPSGYVKIAGERFTSLSNNHPMGHYLEALHHTGYYYTFIGVVQMTAAFFLLIPRMATLGAVLYFPLILNITILSYAVRFDGSLLTSPLMVLANLYLLCWDYDKLKFIFPWSPPTDLELEAKNSPSVSKFPARFFASVAFVLIMAVIAIGNAFDIRPRNTPPECNTQCQKSPNPKACQDFCECIHGQGQPLDKCLDAYYKALEDK